MENENGLNLSPLRKTFDEIRNDENALRDFWVVARQAAARVSSLEAGLSELNSELESQKRLSTDDEMHVSLPAGFDYVVKFQCDMLPLTKEEFDDYMETTLSLKTWLRERLDAAPPLSKSSLALVSTELRSDCKAAFLSEYPPESDLKGWLELHVRDRDIFLAPLSKKCLHALEKLERELEDLRLALDGSLSLKEKISRVRVDVLRSAEKFGSSESSVFGGCFR